MRKTWMSLLALALAVVCTAASRRARCSVSRGGGDDADKWLVHNAEVVMTINIKQMTGSAIMKANLPMIRDLIKNNEEVKAVFEATGLDPLKDVDSILIERHGRLGPGRQGADRGRGNV